MRSLTHAYTHAMHTCSREKCTRIDHEDEHTRAEELNCCTRGRLEVAVCEVCVGSVEATVQDVLDRGGSWRGRWHRLFVLVFAQGHRTEDSVASPGPGILLHCRAFFLCGRAPAWPRPGLAPPYCVLPFLSRLFCSTARSDKGHTVRETAVVLFSSTPQFTYVHSSTQQHTQV